ncbi:MAG TPA: extracellular solute-binding protein [Candidatus Limnocylindrales bacterium]|nr:extracellular solute-binding protein [Candidatus Limnocylindrales bacterium]
MQQPRSRPRALVVLLGLIAIVASACSGATTSTAPSTAATAAPSAAAATATPPPAVTPPPLVADAPGPNGGVVISWFVGLGAGAQPQQLQAEAAFVDSFNASQKDVYIALEIQNNNVAAQKLKTRIAAGDAPDIIGPVGVEGLNLFRDNLLDLAPLIAKTGYSVPGVDPKLVDFFKLGAGGATIGVPYAVYPSYLYFNKDLFDEAGLPYPPTKVGDLYQGKPWDMDAVRTLGMKLTVDKNGNDATSASFDPTNVVQWGFDMQYADNSPLAETSLFGASSFLAADGKTAQIPEQVSTGEKWYNDGVWKDHFIPSAAQISSDLLDKGNEFESGNLAMNESHTWFTCCVYPAAPAKPKIKQFGWAVAPSYNGVTTAKLHADTFSLLSSTKHPDEAFKALTALVASPELLTLYGAMPANPAQQDTFFKSIDANFPGVKLDWTIPQAMLAFPDVPNHQSWVPNYAKSKAAWQAFQNKYRTTSGLDIDAELNTLKTTLQGIFDEPAS